MRFQRLLIDDQIGALTGICTIQNNTNLFGISANHVLSGTDGNLLTTDRVYGFDIDKNEWKHVGNGHKGYNLPGERAAPENYGRFDAGIFKFPTDNINLRSLFLNEHIRNGQYNLLTGLHVFGYSVMEDKIVSGVISEVFSLSSSNTPFDITIESIDNDFLTQKGDSGMLWFDHESKAVAMHIYGYNNPSQISFCVLIDRICRAFQVTGIFAVKL
jgi:hypothetical protein